MKVVLAFLCVLSLALAQSSFKTFSADVELYNDPAVIGTITGRMYYNVSADSNVIQKRIDYALGPVEYIFWTPTATIPSLRYMKCSNTTITTCDAETYSKPAEYLYVRSSDTASGTSSINGRTCTAYIRSGADDFSVSTLFVDAVGAPCRAIYGNGKRIDFTNVVGDTSAFPSNTYTISSDWNCPKPVCNILLDLIYVFDESGSISVADFRRMKDFGINLTNSFTVSADAVQVGIVYFDGAARQIMPVSNDRNSINNAMNSSTQSRGGTNIAAGLMLASNLFPASRGGTQVQRAIILMTDGVSSANNAAAIQKLKDMKVMTFVIAVGTNLNQNILRNISTPSNTTQTYFTTSSYSQLSTIISSISTQACLALPGSPCGANCRGFCGCAGQCQCADSCEDDNPCTTDSCSSANGNGCVYGRTDCDDKNACTLDSCNPNTKDGCVNTPVNEVDYCDDGLPCTIDFCTPEHGCQHKPVDCDDGKPCTTDSCSANNGTCLHITVPSCLCQQETRCDKIDECTNHFCNPLTGNCTTSPVNCDDGNICTVDSCNPTTGCVYTPKDCSDGMACTDDTCDNSVEGGCVWTAINATTWDDFNACTLDYCDNATGVHHDAISCVDGDACTVDNVCETVTGCVFKPKSCGEILGDKISSSCKIALCNSNDTTGEGCYVGEADGAEYDTCGVCFGHGLTCLSATTIGIGVGAAVGIAIGAVAFAALLGAGGYKGMKYYQAMRMPMGEAASNPLYNEDGLQGGENPMFTEEMKGAE